MEKIKSIEVDKWSEPDENHRIKHLGMITRGEAFEQLKAHLESKGLLPDEYFLPGMDGKLEDELPDYDIAECVPNFGGSEGIYLDITLIYVEKGKVHRDRFATGKTLEESADAFFRMSQIGAECLLMLNGRGCSYKERVCHGASWGWNQPVLSRQRLPQRQSGKTVFTDTSHWS